MERISCGDLSCLSEGTDKCNMSPDGSKTCICKDGWIGDECATKTCGGQIAGKGVCNNNGNCINLKCSCNTNYYGSECQKFCDENTCLNGGYCNGVKRQPKINTQDPGTCVCKNGYYGPNCNDRNPTPPNPCIGDEPCGRGGGYKEKDSYINNDIFKWTNVPDWNKGTSTCECDCVQGFYRNVKDSAGNVMKWYWGQKHPITNEIAPLYGNTSTGISTKKDENGKCYPCPPGTYLNTQGANTVCTKCKCPNVKDRNNDISQNLVYKSDFSLAPMDIVCNGGGTTNMDSTLMQENNLLCMPESLWCDNDSCDSDRNNVSCAFYNRNCPTNYDDLGHGEDGCAPFFERTYCNYKY